MNPRIAYLAASLVRVMGADMRIRKSLAVLTLGIGLSASMTGTASAVERDCADFTSQAEAQAALLADPSDPELLDANHNGIACEDYDYAAGAQMDRTPVGSIGTGDGSTADFDAGALPLALGGLGLAVAAAAAVAARRTARGSA
jgi:hypothetical protein